jgi:hypothetical protein
MQRKILLAASARFWARERLMQILRRGDERRSTFDPPLSAGYQTPRALR